MSERQAFIDGGMVVYNGACEFLNIQGQEKIRKILEVAAAKKYPEKICKCCVFWFENAALCKENTNHREGIEQEAKSSNLIHCGPDFGCVHWRGKE